MLVARPFTQYELRELVFQVVLDCLKPVFATITNCARRGGTLAVVLRGL